MNECLLVDMMGEMNPEVFQDDNIESDVEKPFIHSRAAKILVGITAGSIVATAGIILAVKMSRNNFRLSMIQK